MAPPRAVVQEHSVDAPQHPRRATDDTCVLLTQLSPDADQPVDPIRAVVKIASLVSTGSPRSRGEDEAHVRRLVEAEGPLPPIVVHRPTLRIIDGHHRVSAAKRKGFDEIEACFVDGSEESAFVAAVRENVAHGLPLSLADRRSAAERILVTHAHWSDRAIAKTTGLSANTIGAMRRATGENEQLDTRIGEDGRVRPLNAAAGRRLAAELISSKPDASLREIAQAAGICPSTVRDVRKRLDRGEGPLPPSEIDKSNSPLPEDGKQVTTRREDNEGKPFRGRGRGRGGPLPPIQPTPIASHEPADITPVLQMLFKDPSLRLNASGRELLRWLQFHAVTSADSQRIPDQVPPHCIDHLVEVASRCATNWAAIADDWARRSADNGLNPPSGGVAHMGAQRRR